MLKLIIYLFIIGVNCHWTIIDYKNESVIRYKHINNKKTEIAKYTQLPVLINKTTEIDTYSLIPTKTISFYSTRYNNCGTNAIYRNLACNKAGIGYTKVITSYYDTYYSSPIQSIIEIQTETIINKTINSPTIIPETIYESSIKYNTYTTKIKMYYDEKEKKWKIPHRYESLINNIV